MDVDALTLLLSAAFDRAALAVEDGADAGALGRALRAILERLLASP